MGDPQSNKILMALHRVSMGSVCKWRWLRKIGGKRDGQDEEKCKSEFEEVKCTGLTEEFNVYHKEAF